MIIANSIKHHEHCVAGEIISTNQWIRIVIIINSSVPSNKHFCYGCTR